MSDPLYDRFYDYLDTIKRAKTYDFARAEVLYRLGHGQTPGFTRKPTPKPWGISPSTAGKVRRALDTIHAEWDAEREVAS